MANEILKDKVTESYFGGIPSNVTLHAWPVPKLESELKFPNDNEPKLDNFKNYSIDGFHNLNATGYVAIEDDDLTDTGFTDVQTFILASIATVIPLMLLVTAIVGLKMVWKRYKVDKEEGYKGVISNDETSQPPEKFSSYSLPDEIKTSESQFTLSPGKESLSTPSGQLPTLRSNGSIITMTLKNNHLIVETEETLDIPMSLKIESTGTSTTFVTPAEPGYLPDQKFDKDTELIENNNDRIASFKDHGAQIHSPPDDPEEVVDRKTSNTGLSQSDLSASSAENQNPNYRYGNQSGYDLGAYGYSEYSGYATTVSEFSIPHGSSHMFIYHD